MLLISTVFLSETECEMATVQLVKIKRNVVVLGPAGVGKSSIANIIIDRKDEFNVHDFHTERVTRDVEMATCTRVVHDPTLGVECEFEIKVIDTVGLFDDKLSNKDVMEDIKRFIKIQMPEGVHLILFVFRHRRFTLEVRDTFKRITDKLKGRNISDVSALVFTGCEQLSDEGREEFVSDFTKHKHTRDVANFMKKGVFCVGFPKLDNELQELYRPGVQKDSERLRQLVSESKDIRLEEPFQDDAFWKRCTIL